MPDMSQAAQPSTEVQVVGVVLRRIMPILGLIYLFACVDRQNIGFAKLTMVADLGVSESAYGPGASLFFLG